MVSINIIETQGLMPIWQGDDFCRNKEAVIDTDQIQHFYDWKNRIVWTRQCKLWQALSKIQPTFLKKWLCTCIRIQAIKRHLNMDSDLFPLTFVPFFLNSSLYIRWSLWYYTSKRSPYVKDEEKHTRLMLHCRPLVRSTSPPFMPTIDARGSYRKWKWIPRHRRRIGAKTENEERVKKTGFLQNQR